MKHTKCEDCGYVAMRTDDVLYCDKYIGNVKCNGLLKIIRNEK